MNNRISKSNLHSVSEEQSLVALRPMEEALREQIERDEDKHTRGDRGSNSLWDHLKRVARLATQIARQEGVEPLHAYLAGLFHDAGKFAEGHYHKGEKPEELYSIEILNKYAEKFVLNSKTRDAIVESIEQLYRDDPDPTDLTRVLFDADNLDKLGPLGIANYFTKIGLRGGGISESMLYRLTVELTYARHASRSLATDTGRSIARKRAEYTIQFLNDFLENLREDNLFDFRVDTIEFDGLELEVVSPPACDACGGTLSRRVWQIPGIKCSEIHLKHSCQECQKEHELRFCRPRLTP